MWVIDAVIIVTGAVCGKIVCIVWERRIWINEGFGRMGRLIPDYTLSYTSGDLTWNTQRLKGWVIWHVCQCCFKDDELSKEMLKRRHKTVSCCHGTVCQYHGMKSHHIELH